MLSDQDLSRLMKARAARRASRMPLSEWRAYEISLNPSSITDEERSLCRSSARARQMIESARRHGWRPSTKQLLAYIQKDCTPLAAGLIEGHLQNCPADKRKADLLGLLAKAQRGLDWLKSLPDSACAALGPYGGVAMAQARDAIVESEGSVQFLHFGQLVLGASMEISGGDLCVTLALPEGSPEEEPIPRAWRVEAARGGLNEDGDILTFAGREIIHLAEAPGGKWIGFAPVCTEAEWLSLGPDPLLFIQPIKEDHAGK